MQGIFINGERPKSKRAVRDAVLGHIDRGPVELEATSMFGNEYEGSIDEAPAGRYDFVGPDPYTRRMFYGNLFVEIDAEGNRTYKVK